jgi:putative DNA primase/helicase
LALAGELATEYGITGWQTGGAVNGVIECFAKWRESFGGGDIEEQQVLSSVKDFIDRFGDSRFSNINDDAQIKINDRAGYWLDETEGRVYLFNDAGMKEALEKNGLKRGLEVLKKQGWLMTDSDRNKKQYRVHTGNRERFYCIKKVEAA